MNLFFIISVFLLSGVSIVHLIFCFLENELGRRISKVFLMPLLALCLIALRSREVALYLAVFFGWIGDLFLIFKNRSHKFLFMGLIAFFIGHAFFIFEMILKLSYRLPFLLDMGALGFGLLFVFGAYFLVGKKMGKLAFPVSAYAYVLLMLLILSLLLVFDRSRGVLIFVSLGALFFILSDATIAYTYFYKDIKRRDFYIMIPYLLAESGLVLGLAFFLLH
ncbi:MAG: lysoplasmalogenase [Firmicutes bacterium]|nr:lysoplasmalogenase [Bacillota bacterium]